MLIVTLVTCDCRVQATRLPARNNCTQYEPIRADPAVAKAERGSVAYTAFWQRVRGEAEQALLQNEVLDTLADDFAELADEEAVRGHRGGKPLHERYSFMAIRHCKSMRVSALRWHPALQQRAAVCFGAACVRGVALRHACKHCLASALPHACCDNVGIRP